MARQIFFLAVFFFAATAYGETFSVQIGALSNPDPAVIDPARQVGTVYTVPGPRGLTRYRVGPFASEKLALTARARLVDLGFVGAFVKRGDDAGKAPTARPAQQVATQVSRPVTTMQLAADFPYEIPPTLLTQREKLSAADVEFLTTLPADQRARLAYVDGRLHIKVGDRLVKYEP